MGEPAGNIIEIDGGIMEGGGQILRIATVFSTLLKKPIRVRNIRAGRSNPGLRPQHLTGLQLARDLCGGKLDGGAIGSTEITFFPSAITGGSFTADTGTAGSVVLLLQVALPCLLYAKKQSTLQLTGGTNAEMAPQIDYTLMVFKPLAEKFGVKFNCDVVRRGYFPKGGGEIKVTVDPVTCLNAADITDFGQLLKVSGRSFCAGVLPVKVAHAMADSAARILRRVFVGVPMKVERLKESQEAAVGTGSGIILIAETSSGWKLAGSALGKRGVQAEEVGEAAAKELIEDINSQGCIDRHMQDQLIVFMALSKGKSAMLSGPLTLHTETAIHICQLMSQVKFSVTKNPNGTTLIECEGLGLQI